MGLRRLNMLKVGNRAPSHCTPLAVVSAALIPEKGSACFVMGLKHKLSKSMTSNRCNPSQAWPAAAASRSQWGMPARGWGGKFLDGIYYILGIYYIYISLGGGICRLGGDILLNQIWKHCVSEFHHPKKTEHHCVSLSDDGLHPLHSWHFCTPRHAATPADQIDGYI